MSKMTQLSHRRTRGTSVCGARRTEWVVRTRRDALPQLVPLRTRRGLSAALSLLVPSSHVAKDADGYCSCRGSRRDVPIGGDEQVIGRPGRIAPMTRARYLSLSGWAP